MGHHQAVRRPLPQKRWRFTKGKLVLLGLAQSMLAVSAGTLAARSQPAILAACAAAYVISLFVYGHRWERTGA
jgi:hypothetical protein